MLKSNHKSSRRVTENQSFTSVVIAGVASMIAVNLFVGGDVIGPEN